MCRVDLYCSESNLWCVFDLFVNTGGEECFYNKYNRLFLNSIQKNCKMLEVGKVEWGSLEAGSQVEEGMVSIYHEAGAWQR